MAAFNDSTEFAVANFSGASLAHFDRKLRVENGIFLNEQDGDALTTALLHSEAEDLEDYINRGMFSDVERTALTFAYEALQTGEEEFEPAVCISWGAQGLGLMGRAHTEREHALVGYADCAMECAGH